MNGDDLKLQQIVNASVEADLGRRRQPPPFLPEREISSARGDGLSAWRMPLISAAVVGGLLVATTLAVRHSVGSESHTGVSAATSHALASSKLSTIGVGSVRGGGTHGQSAWALGSDGLAVSGDGGTTWAKDPLPTGVPADSVLSVTAPTAGALILAAPAASGFTLFNQATASASWSGVTLTPSWPAKTQLTGPPQAVLVTPGPNNVVAAVASIGAGSTTSATAVFVSTDGGQTYTQHDPGLTYSVASIGFSSATNGVAIEGPTSGLIFHTADGGTTWTQVATATDPGSQISYGEPTTNGQNVEVPQIVQDSDFTTHISVIRSADGGASFTASPAAQVLTIPSSVGQLGVHLGEVSTTRWVIPAAGSILYASDDDGASWKTINSPTLPPGTVRVDMASSQQATAIASTSSCTGIKTGCSNQIELYTTSDGGHTWLAA
jgi:photosystem II stability/assembly factor-like uncharacterized protein